MKIIVTHISLDLDAIASSWLVKNFIPGWKKAQITFVCAGNTLNNLPPDQNPEIIHVDTGFGKFDHHQTSDHTSATKLVFEYLVQKKFLNAKLVPALERLVEFINDTDHFAEVYYPDAAADRYEFLLPQIVEGLKASSRDNEEIINVVFKILDAVLQLLRNKTNAEEEIKNGFVFQSKWGKSIAMETNNEEALKLAQKMGYQLVIRKSPDKGYVRIKTPPSDKLDLTPLYDKFLQIDKKASWFLHASKNMLLNGSSKNPKLVPSSLSLKKLIAIVKDF